jgi:hypothetical protein
MHFSLRTSIDASLCFLGADCVLCVGVHVNSVSQEEVSPISNVTRPFFSSVDWVRICRTSMTATLSPKMVITLAGERNKKWCHHVPTSHD